MFAAKPVEASDASAGVSFIELEQDQDAGQLRSALASDPNVLSVSQVPVRYLAAAPKPRKAPQGGGIGIASTPPDGQVLWNLRQILWQEARGLAGFQDADAVRVAVLDTGVDDQHPDLKIGAYHWQQPDLSRPVSDKDIIGHGTHVSGTIAALINNALGVKGICKCDLSVWKIFDDEPTYASGQGSYVYYVNPIMYRRALAACVETPVDVVNLSIGGPGVPDATEQSLFEQIIAAGTTICAAMGNDRQYGSPTSYPAAIPGVIAIGATGLDDTVTVFSNSGNHISVAAPGKAIWSTLPTYSGQTGFSAVIGSDGRPTQGKAMRREQNYDAWDGTSMATPHVSGCAALLIAKSNAAGNKLTPQQVRQSLMQSADKVAAMNGADFSTDYGAGRINLFNLLQ
jgi:subtilisin family serine protease